MKNFFSAVLNYLKKSDTYLLSLCLISSIYGLILISSATNYMESSSNVYVQIIATLLGIFLYVLFSVIDIDDVPHRVREALLDKTQEIAGMKRVRLLGV